MTKTSPQFSKRPCRPRDALIDIAKGYPKAWKQVDEMRADRGRGGRPDWPQWCFLPLAGTYAIVSGELQVARLSAATVGDVARLGALASWRVTQGIYRFAPAVFDAVKDTPMQRDMPSDVLYRLPEWCVYVETPGLNWVGQILHGFWAHLEWDVSTQRTELRFVMDQDAGLSPAILHLGAWTVEEAIERFIGEAKSNAGVMGVAVAEMLGDAGQLTKAMATDIKPLVSLLLYLCSQDSELGDGVHRPANPQPKRVRGEWRLFPAQKPTTWDVGLRMGSALRRAYQADQTSEGGTHGRPRAHIRVAHWHGFWSGPLDGARRYDVRWLPPIAVNVGDPENLPATVRPVL